MSEDDRKKTNAKAARHIATSGMALTLCLLSMMLFRGLFSLLQALIIPVIMILMTERLPRAHTLAAGLSLLVLTGVFFPMQFVFMIIYLLMAFVLHKLIVLTQTGTRKRLLWLIPYLILNSFLLFSGLRLTDLVFHTQLHAMMLRLSGDHIFRYAAIIALEAGFVSSLHLLAIPTVRRFQMKTVDQIVD